MKTIENGAHFFLSNGMARLADTKSSDAPHPTAAKPLSGQSFVAPQAKTQNLKKIGIRLVLFASFNGLTMGMAGCADEFNPQASPRILAQISAQIRSQLSPRSTDVGIGPNTGTADAIAQNTLIESSGLGHDHHRARPASGF